MTQKDYSSYLDELKAKLVQDRDFFKKMVRDVLEELMEAEMQDFPGGVYKSDRSGSLQRGLLFIYVTNVMPDTAYRATGGLTWPTETV